jgi:cytochrome c-type biogenesis protein CcmF
MMPELGQYALVLALLLAVAQSILPLLGAWKRNSTLMAMGASAAVGQFVFVALAFALLTYAFVVQDFSVAYVAANSNSQLPMYYRFSAVWGAHEGSLLLWAFVLASWTLAVTIFSGSLPETFRARVISVLGFIAFGFLLFILWLSNPFERHLPALTEGQDLNPLLQDFGLIIHPPMLYIGYVGFSVAFAFAIAALLEAKVDQQWVRFSRPWTNLAWAFLTAGIALGSWWAYYELGWGGWWFWDPVENASFMPWLIGTALIHSQAVTEKRGSFRNWTLLLAIAAFSLCLLGTFLVRSGVLVSVHAFASDPGRGSYILAFLALVIGGGLSLFAWRAPKIEQGKPARLMSREGLLLLNNVFLVGACALVFIGTLYPLLVEIPWMQSFLGTRKMSIGAPWFSMTFPWFVIPLMLLMPLGPFSRWGKETPSHWWLKLRLVLALAVLIGAIAWLAKAGMSAWSAGAVMLSAWAAFGTLAWFRARRAQGSLSGEQIGMVLAHLGLAVWLLGAVLVETLREQTDVRMQAGDSKSIAGYIFKLTKVDHYEGPNFRADRAHFEIRRGDEVITTLKPEKRRYLQGQVMTEAGIRPGLTRDLFVSLGEPLDQSGDVWAVRVQYKPFMRWVWGGALLMTLGGFAAALDRRLRARVMRAKAVSEEASNTQPERAMQAA